MGKARFENKQTKLEQNKLKKGVDNISRFKLSIHKTNGYMYASTQEPIGIDEETGQIKYQHIHWGTLGEDLTFYPNERFFFTKPEIRNQLIYPAAWKLDEVYRLVANFAHMPITIREKILSKKKEEALSIKESILVKNKEETLSFREKALAKEEETEKMR